MDKKTIIFMILEAIIFIGIIVCISQCSSRKINVLDQNLLAAQDEIELIRLENGNLLADKAAYIVKEKELSEILSITKEEKNYIEKKLKDKISYISELEMSFKPDTIDTIEDSIIYKNDSTELNIKFRYEDKWFSFNGNTCYKDGISKTSIYDINIPLPLRVGLTNSYTIFVESKNPYAKIIDIEGAVIDGSNLYKKKSKWNLGVHGGFGVNYGIINKKVDIGPYIGVGITYNFF